MDPHTCGAQPGWEDAVWVLVEAELLEVVD